MIYNYLYIFFFANFTISFACLILLAIGLGAFTAALRKVVSDLRKKKLEDVKVTK